MLEYHQLTSKELLSLDKEKTLFLMTVSPLEVHGPHLPLGTDLIVADEVQRRYVKALSEIYPAYQTVRLPPLFLGADPLPLSGSIHIPAVQLEKAICSLAKSLSQKGFRYLLLSDNHGGPRHQLALEAASQKAWKKHRFYVISPFNLIFKKMVHLDRDFLEKIGLEPGRCGDDFDSHAGTNETSLMLAADPAAVRPGYENLPSLTPPAPGRFFELMARLGRMISPELGLDLKHLFRLLAWVKGKEPASYVGAPALASREAGEAMLQEHVNIAMHLFHKAIEGEGPVETRPMLWSLRFLRFL